MEMVIAEAAVSFAVEKLGEAVINKVAFLRGVEEQMNLLRYELERMYGLRQDATQKQATNEGMRVWISQIRRLAHDAEDVIETFNLKIDTPRSSRGMLENCACFPSHLKHLNKLGRDIESIRARLRINFESRNTHKIQDLGHEGAEPSGSNISVQRRRLLPQQTDKDLVGLENDIKSLLDDAILKESPGLLISRITGMGGLGKSTLAREVYNNAEVTPRFDFRAWVVVSEEFNSKQVIEKLLHMLGSDSREGDMDKLSPVELKSNLFEGLRGKQYFIVLDDVWEQQHWELLADAFPDEQDKRSRLLVTSRTNSVPRTARHAHELKLLDVNRSWQLFLKKSFIDDTNGKCPPELEEIGRDIVSKCRGLPLAISVMGGLLLEQRQSQSGWGKILKGMNSLLGRSENYVSAILELSYHNLSPRLKSCFLCLGFFKEDAIIHAEKLIQVWIAEGLIPQDGREETMEEIARGYLDELINRNIAQVKDIRKDDQVKSCQVHDLIRELSIKKAEEEIGFNILKDGTNSQSSNNFRHLAIYCSIAKFKLFPSQSNKHVRSLFIHGAYIEDSPSLNFKSFPLLRVLDFEGFGLQILPKSIGKLVGLKYLGLRGNKLKELPKSLGRLINLQVLDMTSNYAMLVPDVLWKMYNLRHLYIGKIISATPLRLDTLKNLRTLIYSTTMDKWWPNHVMEMTDLRKLEVCLDNNVSDAREFITSLANMENLASLKLIAMDDRTEVLGGFDTLHCLTELELKGKLTALPSADNFPPNLSHLTLDNTMLAEDPMPELEKLPKLLHLNLSPNAYVGRKMVISDDGFPRLRVLLIRGLQALRTIELVGEGNGTLTGLKQFEIDGCHNLESVPNKLMTSTQGFYILRCQKMKTELKFEDGNSSK